MGLVRFDVCLDQPCYYAGQTLSGKLVIVLDKPMSMKGVYVKCSGEGSIHWEKTRCRPIFIGFRIETIKYKNSEEYLSLKQQVFGNDAETELQAGQHVIPFNCQLPMNLPSSFEGAHGSVRYSIKATIKRSTWKSDRDVRQPVTVMFPCDLNQFPDVAIPVNNKRIKTFCGHSRPLYMYVLLPAWGFVPGQKVPLVVILGNFSNVRVKFLNVSLLQHVTVHAPPKSNTTTAYVYRNKIPVPKGLIEVPVDFVFPPVPVSISESCNIIDINYELHVEAAVNSWCHSNLETKMPIIVGNIPLANYETLCDTMRCGLDSAMASLQPEDD